MSDQEPLTELQENEERGGLESSTINHLTMLQLNATTSPTDNYHPTTTELAVPAHQHCTISGNGSMKRRSTSSLSFQEPTSKKPTLQPSCTTTTDHHGLHGFTKLPLPITTPLLRRCVSDPINSTGTDNAGSSAASVQFLNLQSPENHNISVPAASPSPANPSQSFRRPVSYPTSSAYQVTTNTPPRVSLARTFSRSPSSGEIGPHSVEKESPNSKRLKKMKEKMREMRQWWDQIMHEGEDDDYGSEINNRNTLKDNCETESVEAIQESVWVERNGECKTIHFKCPCGEGYEVRLQFTSYQTATKS
ncbi:unnamed protein product [Ilex paraguariensis]|uniref:Uncharacterized protein n=1 Tax=Ilex paraguariensis TaxID=185542 RepID=A0ABC8UT49_9AQUA